MSFADGVPTFGIVVRQYDWVVFDGKRSRHGQYIAVREDGVYGVILLTRPSRLNIRVVIERGESYRAALGPADVTIEQKSPYIVWVPAIQHGDTVWVHFDEETFEDRVRRLTN